MRITAHCTITDASCGDRGLYPEEGLVLYCYLAHGGRGFSGRPQKVDFGRSECPPREQEFTVGPMIWAPSTEGVKEPGGVGGLAWGGLTVSSGDLSGPRLCFCLFAYTDVRDQDRPSVSFQTEPAQKVPLGFAEWDVEEASSEGTLPRAFPLLDPSSRGVVKGWIRVDRMAVEAAEWPRVAPAGTRGGETALPPPVSPDGTKATERACLEFFATFRDRIRPSSPALARFQVPYYDAGAGRIPAAFFSLPAALAIKEMEERPRDSALARAHLLACLSAALELNGMSEVGFCSAVEEQLASRGPDRPPTKFFACVKTAFEACCLVAHRIRYTPDHTSTLTNHPWHPVAFRKVERFLDCLVTMAGGLRGRGEAGFGVLARGEGCAREPFGQQGFESLERYREPLRTDNVRLFGHCGEHGERAFDGWEGR